jgi:hypothetical protein
MQTQNENDQAVDSLPDPSENITTNDEITQPSQNAPLINDDGTTTPNPTIIVPSQAETPPVVFRSKKSKTSYVSKSISKSKSETKSLDSSRIRRSARIMSGIGTGKKVVQDNTVHAIDDDSDDSEKTISASPIDEPEKEIEVEVASSPISVPAKPKPKPSPVATTKPSTATKTSKGKENVTSIKKGPKTKFIPIPLIHPDDRENFEKYWKIKAVPIGRIYDFEELAKGGIDLLKYVEPLGWTNFFNLKESVLPQLVQAFYHNANVHPDKNSIISNIKGTQIQLDPNVISDLLKIQLEGVEIYGNKWFSKLDINRETLIGEMFNEQGAQMTNPSSSFLKKEFKILHNICLHSIFPRTGSNDKVTENDFLVMHHLSKGIKLNLPYLIIQHLIYATSSGIKKIALP